MRRKRERKPVSCSADDERRIGRVLARGFGGIHHVPGWETREGWGNGIAILVSGPLATYDFGHLTHLVVAAHDEAVRVELTAASFGYIRIALHPRKHGLTLKVWERHLTMEQAVEGCRGSAEALRKARCLP